MIEIWKEFRFKTTNQRLADHVRTLTNNGWFSDLETLEIHQQIYIQTNQLTPIKVTMRKIQESQKLNDNDLCTANSQTQTLTREENKKK